jgi:nitrite reductase/ring-hydroxylating ferredoxin subunit
MARRPVGPRTVVSCRRMRGGLGRRRYDRDCQAGAAFVTVVPVNDPHRDLPQSIDPPERDIGAHGRPVRGRPLPAEGENGLFSQSWFPICLASQVSRDEIKGYDFLDGRVIVFRSIDGAAHVLSAYCPHLGADLSVGEIVDGTIRCAFHHWCYDSNGRCVRTAVGDQPPPAARLFRFPTVEKHGIVWAFNGERPSWQVPDFPLPAEELAYRVLELPESLPVDPWVICCNTPDMQHIRALHGITFDGADPHDFVGWTDHSMLYDFAGVHRRGEEISNRIGIFGTSLYYQVTMLEGRWFGFLAPLGLPRPRTSRVFMVVAARRDDGSPEEVEAFLDRVVALETSVVAEDVPVMKTIRFRPGTLTQSDRTLARFFEYLRRFPRAHPSAEFIR